MSKIEEFQDELLRLSRRIRASNNPNIEDIKRLEYLFKLGGISEYNIESLYRNCGFYSWEEYIQSKYLRVPEKISSIHCVDDKIHIVASNILNVTSSMC